MERYLGSGHLQQLDLQQEDHIYDRLLGHPRQMRATGELVLFHLLRLHNLPVLHNENQGYQLNPAAVYK